tara:strand:- start:322 stop:1242 length:921 start_codon:yes stop_codon:yes gene_type:complete
MINGDNILSLFERFWYFPQCIKNHFMERKLSITLKKPRLNFNKIQTCTGSPSRIACNTFWKSVDYEKISKSIGEELNFFDIGSGNGEYGNLMKNLSGNSFGSYAGIDIYKHNDYPLEFHHYLDDAKNISKYINKNINFIISQSSLEHIKDDRLVIEEVTRNLIKLNKRFLQIHMVPSAPSLYLYLWHGWRQYSLRNISNISNKIKMISDDVEIFVIPIGGYKGFIVHLFTITITSYYRKIISYLIKKQKHNITSTINDKNKYNKINQRAVLSDLNNNSFSLNSFWAMIIKHKDVNFNLENDDAKLS